MPGFRDVEAITVYPADPGGTFRVPTVQKATGFDVRLEAEAGNGRIGPGELTPYRATIQIRNLTRFALVTVNAAPANAQGNIGQNETWKTNDQLFVFKVAGGSAGIDPGDLLEVVGAVAAGAPLGDVTNDFSFVQSGIFQVI
ncbi:hypothetical protein [Krasilnikovia sp. MM14-A1004]|uniref:hypothetical protein n=1 Tax=Krasilnikovia sp. MM14-A1004 TaxID=3373541 RepID=UPI00399D385A